MHFALRSLSETARISRSLSRALTSPTIYSGGVIAKKKRKEGKKKKRTLKKQKYWQSNSPCYILLLFPSV